MQSSSTIDRELLLLGGGHSHVAVIKHFGMHACPGVRLTVITRDVHTPYSGMLPGLVAGHYTVEDSHIDLRKLCEANGARLIRAEVIGLDRGNQRVLLRDRPAMRYDWLSVNTGSRPALSSIPGAGEHGIAVKPIDLFLDHWRQLLCRIADRNLPFRLLIVGGGAAGVEIALACHRRAQRELGDQATYLQVELLCASTSLLPTHNLRVQRYFSDLLQSRGIGLVTGKRVLRARSDAVELDDASVLPADALIWAIHAGAQLWPRESGLDCDADGFIRVNAHLQSRSDPRIFAAGDVASLPRAVAKSGVYAVREGPLLARNLQRAISDETLLAYRPQRRFLSLLSTGDRHAVISRGRLFARGNWVWRWKDRIDRAFMRRYATSALPPAESGDTSAMRCGGCAAKVGADLLGRVITQLRATPRADIPTGLLQGEDATVIVPPAGQHLVQSVDYFRAFIADPYLLGRIAVVHCVGDLLAMGATPHSALAIATVPYASAPIMEESLHLLMQGALRALHEEGMELSGGHSNEGSELAFGLSVTGFARPDELLYKSGLRAQQGLILCKALGHGILLAANMRAAAEARWIDGAINNMLLSQRQASAILRAHGTQALTDITGFGLLGHLQEMLRASRIGAVLDLEALPVLPGTLELLARGYRSSLHDDNRIYLTGLQRQTHDSGQLADLLLDPQTAGGLLAGVPIERAGDCVNALRAAGYADATLIGTTDDCVEPGCVRLA